MKLTARKTMVALGTAAAVTLSGLSAPAMAADAKADATVTANKDAKTSETKPAEEKTADAQKKDEKGDEKGKVKCTSEEGDALYSQKYHSVEIDKAAALKSYDDLSKAMAKVNASQLDRDGKAALADAESALNNAKFRLEKVSLPEKICGKSTSPEYGELKNAADQIVDAERDLNTAASKLRDAQPVVCSSGDDGKDDSGSAGSLNFGSITQSFGSSDGEKNDKNNSGSAGQMRVTKDGKAKCVSRFDFFSDKLKSIVAILTVVFTVITTVTKINETIQKQVMPK